MKFCSSACSVLAPGQSWGRHPSLGINPPAASPVLLDSWKRRLTTTKNTETRQHSEGLRTPRKMHSRLPVRWTGWNSATPRREAQEPAQTNFSERGPPPFVPPLRPCARARDLPGPPPPVWPGGILAKGPPWPRPSPTSGWTIKRLGTTAQPNAATNNPVLRVAGDPSPHTAAPPAASGLIGERTAPPAPPEGVPLARGRREPKCAELSSTHCSCLCCTWPCRAGWGPAPRPPHKVSLLGRK